MTHTTNTPHPVWLGKISLTAWFSLLLLLMSSCSTKAGDEAMKVWQWPAGRAVVERALVEVISLKKDKGGIFGIRLSPSIGDVPPDPMIMRGTIIAGNIGHATTGGSVKAQLPKVEVNDIEAGAIVAMGLSESGHVICIDVAPAEAKDNLDDWLINWECK